MGMVRKSGRSGTALDQQVVMRGAQAPDLSGHDDAASRQ